MAMIIMTARTQETNEQTKMNHHINFEPFNNSFQHHYSLIVAISVKKSQCSLSSDAKHCFTNTGLCDTNSDKTVFSMSM